MFTHATASRSLSWSDAPKWARSPASNAPESISANVGRCPSQYGYNGHCGMAHARTSTADPPLQSRQLHLIAVMGDRSRASRVKRRPREYAIMRVGESTFFLHRSISSVGRESSHVPSACAAFQRHNGGRRDWWLVGN